MLNLCIYPLQDVARLTLTALRNEKAEKKTMTLAGPRAWTTQEVLLGGCCPFTGLVVSSSCVSQRLIAHIYSRDFGIHFVLINNMNPLVLEFCEKMLGTFHTLQTLSTLLLHRLNLLSFAGYQFMRAVSRAGRQGDDCPRGCTEDDTCADSALPVDYRRSRQIGFL